MLETDRIIFNFAFLVKIRNGFQILKTPFPIGRTTEEKKSCVLHRLRVGHTGLIEKSICITSCGTDFAIKNIFTVRPPVYRRHRRIQNDQHFRRNTRTKKHSYDNRSNL